MRGRVGALIELGAGFNPVLSGRENIYNNGAILGFTRKEIDEKLQYIIDFAELEEFIDMPVRNYSSGMKVRLGFAIAAQMEPDVLIIDEVLAVGDLGFVLKCFKTIDTILPNTAIVFVSHSMPMVSRICNKIILMDKGEAKFQGKDVSKAIDLYYTRFSNSDKAVVHDEGKIELIDVKIKAENFENGLQQLNWKDDLVITLYLKNKELINIPYVKVFIYDKEQRSAGTLFYKFEKKRIVNDLFEIELTYENLQFSKGIYSFSIVLFEDYEKLAIYRVNSIKSFQVIHHVESWTPLLLETKIKY
jgi:lipopolysaccharide transport system ATP-binding protein